MSHTMRRLTVPLIATALVLAGCTAEPSGGGSSDPDEPVTLTFASYGGTFTEAQKEAWQDPYVEEHPNVTFENTSPSDVSQLKAQVEAGVVSWDLADVPAYFAASNCGTLVEELDVPDLDSSQYDEQIIGDCYVGNYRYATIVSYSTKTWPDPDTAPKTVSDFFDTDAFPGRRALVPAVGDGILEYALLADGVAADDLYPLDVDRALEVYDSIREETTFAANNGALLQLVTDGQADIVMMVAARSKAALDAGAPIQPIWDVTMNGFNSLVIPKGSPHKEAAERWMSYLMSPEPSARFAELSGTSPSNNDAQPVLDENTEKVNAFGSENTGENVTVNNEWWSENFTETSARVTNWLNG